MVVCVWVIAPVSCFYVFVAAYAVCDSSLPHCVMIGLAVDPPYFFFFSLLLLLFSRRCFVIRLDAEVVKKKEE